MFKRLNLSIGLDLGSSYIKAIKLEVNNRYYVIRDFIIQKNLPVDNLSSLIKEIFDRIKVQNIPVNISLSGQNVVSRYVSLPLMEEQEFRNALKFEVSKYIPFSIQEIYFDGCILKKDTTHNKMLTLVVAAKKEYVNQKVLLIKKLGYHIKTIDVDCLALANCFNFNLSKNKELENKTIGVLNLGASFSNLNIIEGGVPVLSRDIRIAGNEITAKISTDLSCDFETAEKIKIEASKDENQYQKIKSSLENILSLLAQELRISFDYYESQSVSTVERLYICGGQSLLRQIVEILSYYLGIETLLWDPLEGFEFHKDLDIEEIKKNSLYLAVALGLGLK